MTNAEANRIIAESVGDEGFWPAETCRDHQNRIPEFKGYGHIGEPCLKCGAIIQRGEPKDFCGSLDLTVAAMSSHENDVDDFGWTLRWRAYTGLYEAEAWQSSPENALLARAKAFEERKVAAEALAHAYAQVLVAAKGEGNG